MIQKEFHVNNRNRLAENLLPNSLAIFHANDVYYRNGDQPYRYRQQSDLFYLTGIGQEKTILLLFPDCPNPDLREVLFIIEPTEALLTWEGHKLSREEAIAISGIKKVRWVEQFETILPEVMSYADHVYLNAYEYPKFSTEVPYRDLRFAHQIRQHWPNHDYRRAAPLLNKLRLVKSPEEIEMIREAIQVTGKAFRRILKFLKPGVKEYQAEAELIHEFISCGAQGHAYHPIIASGINACTLHYIENRAECRDGELLLMDFGAEAGNYAADLSRTVPVNGKFTARQRQVYDAVLRVQRQAGRLLVPGNTIDRINKEVNQLMELELISMGLLTDAAVKKQDPEKPLFTKYFMHGTSHFLGLDVHDAGSKYEPLQPGMVLTFEPGIYIREEGLGIRIENNYLVTESAPVDLTAEIPAEAEEIEEIMNKK